MYTTRANMFWDLLAKMEFKTRDEFVFWLRWAFVDKNLSCPDISELLYVRYGYRVSARTVQRWLSKYKIITSRNGYNRDSSWL